VSWLHKTSFLAKTAAVRLMYHGTSDKNLSSILSEGLNVHHETVWSEEKAKEDERSRASYGGIYFTNNFMTAKSAAGTAIETLGGKSRVMVMARLELKTPHILMDEDMLPAAQYAIDIAFRINSNEWWLGQWYMNDFYEMDKVVDEYLRLISIKYAEFTDSPQSIESLRDPRRGDFLRPYIKDFIQKSVIREIVIGIEKEEDYWKRLERDVPPLAETTLAEAEANYRNAANTLMQKMNYLVDDPRARDRFISNVRVMEPITYRGKNRIVLVARLEEYWGREKDEMPEPGYKYRIVVYYNTDSKALTQLIADHHTRIGGSLIVRDRQGNQLASFDKDE